MKEAKNFKNFHLPLPTEIYAELKRVSEASRQPATRIARDAIEHWLLEQQRERMRSEISSYAKSHAGTDFDLDEDLESAGTERLLSAAEPGARTKRTGRKAR